MIYCSCLHDRCCSHTLEHFYMNQEPAKSVSQTGVYYLRQNVKNRANVLLSQMELWCSTKLKLRASLCGTLETKGLAMTNKDMSSLTDIYQLLQNPKSTAQTSYILQFLWSDLTSSYNIVGPYLPVQIL